MQRLAMEDLNSITNGSVSSALWLNTKLRVEMAYKHILSPAIEYYGEKETTTTLGVSYSLNDLGPNTAGYAVEALYWSSRNLGVGTELGSYDAGAGSYYTALTQVYRFPLSGKLRRFAPYIKTGQYTDFGSDNTYLAFGGGLYAAITQTARLDLNVMQAVIGDPASGNLTIKAGLTLKF